MATRAILAASFRRFGCLGASPHRQPHRSSILAPFWVAICDLLASFRILAHVAELADAYGSGPYGETRGGSSPLVSIN
jgi:hypothetical protein